MEYGTVSMGKSLPHDDMAERAVLGAILINNHAFEEVSDILSPSDFYSKPNQTLYSAINDFKTEVHTEAMDTVVLYNYLKEKDLIDKCGGVSYISELTNNVSVAAQAKLYADIVLKLAVRRNIITLCSLYQGEAMELGNDPFQVLDDLEKKLSELREQGGSQEDVSIRSSITKVFDIILAKIKGTWVNDMVPSGFDKLDSMMGGGFSPTDYIIIGARPSIGKTAFALSIIRNMILPPYPKKVAFFSLEMSMLQVTQRLLSSVSKVPLKKVREGRFMASNDMDLDAVVNSSAKLSEGSLYIFDTPNMKLTEIRSKARSLKRENGLDAIFIDYIGLIDSNQGATVPRFEQVAYVSRNLKALARELKVPVIVLSQVNREAEDEVKEPQLNNLRDSGAIEQDADLVMFLHRKRNEDRSKMVRDNEGNEGAIQLTKVIVAKQRNGETGSFTVGFKKNCVSFENTESEYLDENPRNHQK